MKTKMKLKALEIIKEKNVDVDFLKCCFQEFDDGIGLKHYNTIHIKSSSNGKEIAKDEYGLLKEVLL